VRKVRSREYCHNCQQYSRWEFEEREGNQIITCPVCGHLHFRVIEGSYVDFSIEFRGETIDNMNRIRELLEQYPESRSEFEQLWATLEFGRLQDAEKLAVTGQRWGQDPSQTRGWAVPRTVITYWASNTTSSTNTFVYVASTCSSTW
jgi:hypothetical protein